ncbi:MAG: hypothetical protein NTV00_11380 [Methylococcales bacterium]|nr:hypothetical protein [Methylococcales bacterium]
MKNDLSSTAVIYAILSINSEISLQKEYLESSDIDPDERDNEEDILEDLEQAFMEFIELYKIYLRADSKLPSIDELLNSEL